MKNLFIKHYMRLTLIAPVLMAQVFISCKKANLITAANDGRGITNGTALKINSGTPVNPTPWIGISNTDAKTWEVYNSNVTTWDSTTAYWIFKPTTDLGYSAGAVTALKGGIGDARMHFTAAFPDKAYSAFAIQGGLYLAIGIFNPVGTHKRGEKLWECTIPSAYDPNNHGIELLPNGNLVVAGYGKTDATLIGNWIRIYDTSTSDTTHHVQTYLNGAHALYWDAGMNRLWAGGQIKIGGIEYHGIFAYIIGGTRTAPTITEDVSLRKVLPYPPNGNPSSPTGAPDHLQWPHDIMPDYDNSNILYYADHSGVYSFNKTTLDLMPTPGASHCYTGTDIAIKSACKMAGSYITVTKINNAANDPYETNEVEFYDPTSGSLAFNRTVAGYTIYRSRIWEIPIFKPFGFTDGSKSVLGVYYQGTWKFIGKPDLSYGQPTDIAVPGDYNGDGITENAVWNAGSPYMWSIPTGPNYNYGTTGDIPVPADYDGDGRTDVAVWRPSTFRWYITTAADVDWGQAGDIPVPADYDGDGKADVTIWRPSTGQWYVRSVGAVTYGQNGDIPVPADYLGQGFVQKSVFRPANHTWYIYGQASTVMANYSAGDIPVPGDYDGDGKVDKALYRPSTGQLYVNGVLTGTVTGATSNYKPLNLPYCIRKFFFP